MTNETVSHVDNALLRFDSALKALSSAKSFAKPKHQVDLFAAAGELLDAPDGLNALYDRAARFDEAGVFHAGPWEDASRLQPTLVGGCLVGEGQYPTVESLSELRLLAIAAGRVSYETFSADDAKEFLREAIALNLDLLFVGKTELTRQRGAIARKAQRLLRFIVDELELRGLRKDVVEEIGFRLAQRPIVTAPVRRLIELAAQLPSEESESDREANATLHVYQRALGKPSPLSESCDGVNSYRQALRNADEDALHAECRGFAESLEKTGLGNPYHAVLVRYIAKRFPSMLGDALGLEPYARAELVRHQTFIQQLVRVAVLPSTADVVEGFVGMLNRGLLSRDEVTGGLRRLVDLDLNPKVRNGLRARFPKDSGVTANSVLVAAAIDIIGQPLGIGQGESPTCQAARALSLWSMHAPGYLLDVLATAARDDVVEVRFEGLQMHSNLLPATPSQGPGAAVDPVSAILVPHLDRIYGEMLRRAHGRGVDAHKWVNPAMYGRWVPNGFCSALDISGRVTEFRRLVRRFYATHHPAYNDDNHALVYPNPVGIFVTDVHGNLLGPHAVSLLRIADDGNGKLRAYFFNPNDEGRQNWGQSIAPTVMGNGEIPGESSLPLHQFVSRLYAFHYNPYEEGDAFAVPGDLIEDVTALARESWGRALPWVDE